MTQTFTPQIFGAFLETIPESEEYLTLNFAPMSAPRKRRWSNYGLSADFLGDYFAAFFPGDALPDSEINRRDTVKAAVSYIANELLENAVKYSDEIANLPISITLYLYEHEIIFEVVNHASLLTVETYQVFIQELLSIEPEEFYIRQLETAATHGTSSNMGLITMINDYSASFGWEFKPTANNPSVIRVCVMARLVV